MTHRNFASRRSAATLPKILLVDDDEETQQLVRVVLRNRCQVYVAASAAEAREQLRSHPGEICMILMDLALEGRESGLALMREVRRKVPWRRIPIVAETAHVFPGARAAAFRAGCDAYLAKPYYPQELRSVVDHYLSKTRRD